MKPPMVYFGAKMSVADEIIALFPEHDGYVEPFGGSLAVLLAKPVEPMEVVNDLSRDLMTFWRMLRDHTEEFIQVCQLTPHSRAEMELASDREGIDDLERARRVWVRLTQGRIGTLRKTGWRFYLDDPGALSGIRRKADGRDRKNAAKTDRDLAKYAVLTERINYLESRIRSAL